MKRTCWDSVGGMIHLVRAVAAGRSVSNLQGALATNKNAFEPDKTLTADSSIFSF